MATPNIVPRADSEGGIGTASKYWAAAYIDFVYVGAGKVGRDTDNYIDFSTDNYIVFRVNNVSEVTIDAPEQSLKPEQDDGFALGTANRRWSDLFLASGAVVNFDNGNVTLTHSSNALTLADNDYMQFGSSGDLQIYHSGVSSAVNNTTGHLYISNGADDSDIIFQCDDGSGGVTAYLTLDGGEGHTIASKEINFADSTPATFGNSAGGDLEIKEESGHSYISNFTGNLNIINNANDSDIRFYSDDGSGGIAEYLRLDGGNERLDINAPNGMLFSDNIQLKLGTGGDLRLYHTGTGSVIQNSVGNLTIQEDQNDGDIIFRSDDGSGGTTPYLTLDGGDVSTIVNTIKVLMPNLPTSDPSNAGQLWNDSGTLKISAG